MWLIDALYDRGRFVVASAEVAMDALYTGHAWAFEFDRTLSRLSEMTRQAQK
jgi:cell division protein ZapE